MPAVIASAPGKVLITGGYLILERPNAGLVLSTTARFYAIVKPLHEHLNTDSWAWAWIDVKVTSPQLSRETEYKMSLKNLDLQCTSSRDSSNAFVEQAVQYSVAAAKATCSNSNRDNALQKLLLQGLHVTILGSNDFYSFRSQIEVHGLALLPETLSMISPFSSITLNTECSSGISTGEKCKPEVAKTGLGSSAAMTVSVVAALLHYLGAANLSFSGADVPEDRMTYSGLDLVHAIAQSAHCMAQGKIGSGFDVSAAVYGSQRYVRFSPSVLSSSQMNGSNQILHMINDIMKSTWDHEKTEFSLPPMMALLLGEPGSGGSSTPSMVGAVKRWQGSHPERSLETCRRLAEANSTLEMQFKTLSRFAREQWEIYKHVIIKCSVHKPEKWMELITNQVQDAIVKTLLGVRETFFQIRFHMRLMGKDACAPIEPESQTRLLDVTMDMEGVLLAGVPGAGGYDAVFAIALGEANKAVTKAWSSLGVLPLLVGEDPRGVCLETDDPRVREVSSSVSSLQIR